MFWIKWDQRVFSPDDGGGGGGGEGDGGDEGGGEGGDEGGGETLLAGRFKGVEALEKGYTELHSSSTKKREEIVAEVTEELKLTAREGLPEKPDGYEFKPIEGLVPEGLEVSMQPDNPVFVKWRETAHEMGLTPDQFNLITNLYVENEMSLLSDPAMELEKLGENGQVRVDRVDLWAKKNLTDASYQAISHLSGEAGFIIAMEEMMKKAGTNFGGGDGEGEGAETLTRKELETMMRDPRYKDPRKREEAFVKKVMDGFKKLYPNTAA